MNLIKTKNLDANFGNGHEFFGEIHRGAAEAWRRKKSEGCNEGMAGTPSDPPMVDVFWQGRD